MKPDLDVVRAARGAVGARPLSSACPLCGHASGVTVHDRDGKSGRPLDVVACGACGFVRIDPLPAPGALAAWYAGHYRSDYKGVVRPRLRHVWRAAGLALDRLAFAAPFVRAGARTLDVGAGGGEFVALLARRGFDAHGVEPDDGHAGFARHAYGVPVRTGTIDALPEDGDWDLVTLFHVLEHLADPVVALEHLADPVVALERLRRRLAPGGTLLVEVPNVEYLRCAPSNLFFAAHVHYFSRRTLARAATLAGLEAVSPWTAARAPNLRVALRAAAAPARRTVASATAPTGGEATLRRALRAQSMRTWGRYLAPARSLPRLAARWRQWRTEAALERRFADASAVLEHRFGTPARRATPVPPAPRTA